MAWIRVIDQTEATGKLARRYRSLADPDTGVVDHVLSIHSLRPSSLDGHLKLYHSAMKVDDGLSHREREVIAVVVSAVNDCEY